MMEARRDQRSGGGRISKETASLPFEDEVKIATNHRQRHTSPCIRPKILRGLGCLTVATLVALMLLCHSVGFVEAQLVTEIYETCTALEGETARCGPGANCFLMNGYPSCQCVVDVATGLPLAGNPYKACTWDISGTWQLFSFLHEKTGFSREILSPVSNEPFVIRLDRTDALLKTNYMLGAIFIVTALTSFSMGVCGRAFLDARDNTSIIFEQAEGFLDQGGRTIFLRTSLLDTTLSKKGQKTYLMDRWDVKGKWQKQDGSEVEILDLKKPHKWPNVMVKHELTKNWSAYWYNDAGYGAALLRLSMALFLDKTLKPERAAFNTNARFCQVGWYGALHFGSSNIALYSPADGKPIFTLNRIDVLPPFTPVGAAANLATQFAPSTKEVIMVPSTTNLSITAENPPEEPEDPLPTPAPLESRPAIRIFGDLDEQLSQPQGRLSQALAASGNIMSGLPSMLGMAARI